MEGFEYYIPEGMLDTPEEPQVKRGVLEVFGEGGRMNLKDYSKQCHEASYANGWWHDPDTGEELPTEGFLGAHVIGCKIGLIGSEASEIMEGHRKQKMDEKLPQYKEMDVEMVDVLIRVFDLAGKMGSPLDEIYAAKMKYNNVRPDHALENRKKGGKLY